MANQLKKAWLLSHFRDHIEENGKQPTGSRLGERSRTCQLLGVRDAKTTARHYVEPNNDRRVWRDVSDGTHSVAARFNAQDIERFTKEHDLQNTDRPLVILKTYSSEFARATNTDNGMDSWYPVLKVDSVEWYSAQHEIFNRPESIKKDLASYLRSPSGSEAIKRSESSRSASMLVPSVSASITPAVSRRPSVIPQATKKKRNLLEEWDRPQGLKFTDDIFRISESDRKTLENLGFGDPPRPGKVQKIADDEEPSGGRADPLSADYLAANGSQSTSTGGEAPDDGLPDAEDDETHSWSSSPTPASRTSAADTSMEGPEDDEERHVEHEVASDGHDEDDENAVDDEDDQMDEVPNDPPPPSPPPKIVEATSSPRAYVVPSLPTRKPRVLVPDSDTSMSTQSQSQGQHSSQRLSQLRGSILPPSSSNPIAPVPQFMLEDEEEEAEEDAPKVSPPPVPTSSSRNSSTHGSSPAVSRRTSELKSLPSTPGPSSSARKIKPVPRKSLQATGKKPSWITRFVAKEEPVSPVVGMQDLEPELAQLDLRAGERSSVSRQGSIADMRRSEELVPMEVEEEMAAPPPMSPEQEAQPASPRLATEPPAEADIEPPAPLTHSPVKEEPLTQAPPPQEQEPVVPEETSGPKLLGGFEPKTALISRDQKLAPLVTWQDIETIMASIIAERTWDSDGNLVE